MANRYSSISEQALQVRDPQDYPDSLKFVLNILTINEVPKVVGSASYLQHKYPGDVDVFENVTVQAPVGPAIQYYVDQFKTIAQELTVVEKDIYFIEFKAGIDIRYKYNINASTTNVQLLAVVTDLEAKNLLTPDRKQQLIKTFDNNLLFADFLRQWSVIRWSLTEMINGNKELVANKTITLAEALAMPAVVKLDTVSWFENRLQSVEVFYFLQYRPQPGKATSFYDMGNYVQNLLADVEHYKQPQFYNPLKIMKRLWSLSRVIDCKQVLQKLTPLFGSDIAALNQIVADVDIISELIKVQQMVPWDKIFLEILGFKKRVFNHLDFNLYQGFVQHIDNMHILWMDWKLTSNVKLETLNTQLQAIKNFLKPIIDSRSEQFLLEFQNSTLPCAI